MGTQDSLLSRVEHVHRQGPQVGFHHVAGHRASIAKGCDPALHSPRPHATVFSHQPYHFGANDGERNIARPKAAVGAKGKIDGTTANRSCTRLDTPGKQVYVTEESGHEGVGRSLIKLPWRAELLDSPVPQNHNAIR